MSSAKFYIKHPTEKSPPAPPKTTTTTKTTNPYQTNLAQKSCKPLPSLPRRIQFPLLITQIGERELHRWLVGSPERRRTPWDAAGRHCVREEEELTRQKPRDPQNESSSSTREEEEKHGTKNPSQEVSDRRQQPRPPVRPPARPPATGYSRSP